MTTARWTGKALLAWQRAHSSLWFIPALFVLIAGGMSTAALEIDAALGPFDAGGWWLFTGNADGARTVLSVIAGSLITVIAVAFSVTIIAIQQASTQFTPRVLRNFTRDRGNQIVLGTYIATFAYSLLVLRRVREAGGDVEGFVPSVAISTAMLLALVSLGLLVYFIHHVSEALQVSAVLSSIRRDLDHELMRMFPGSVGHDAGEPADFDALMSTWASSCDGPHAAVTCDAEGFLRRINDAELAAALPDEANFAIVDVRIGQYVRPGDVVVRVWSDPPPGEELTERMRGAFQLDRDRSLQQDPLFGIRQIVDIGVKALSPGINDPTTAEHALDHLGGALTMLVHRDLPSPMRVLSNGARVLFRTPTFADYVEACFAQLRRAARSDLHVSLYLIDILGRLANQSSRARSSSLRHQLEEVVAGFDQEGLTDRERTTLRRALDLDGGGTVRHAAHAHPWNRG
mgnify:CR=1 FL=1